MNARSIFSGLVIFPLSCAIAVTSLAQTAKHSAAPRDKAADAASRNQLATELTDFQSNPQDLTLRNKIIVLAKSLEPAPAIPLLAQDDFAKATAQLAAASSQDDFETAAQLFEQIVVLAPWYAEAYYNAADAYAKANEYDRARRNLSLYLSAVRPGIDTQNAELLRRNLDRKQATQFQQTLQQFSANPSDAARLHIIQLALAMGTLPDIPEEARGHYVMAVVYSNTASDNADFERAITEYKAALLIAPWWGDAYKKLAGAQTLASKYDDAIASLIFYQAIQPGDARNTQDEIYRLKALGKTAAEDQAKKQSEEQRRKLLLEQQKKDRASSETMQYSIEGRWYPVIAPTGYFAGGESNPQCDYTILQNKGRWEIRNTCSPQKRTIEDVDVQPRQLRFKLVGRDPGFPFSEVLVSFNLSNDGQSMDGTETTYDKRYHNVGDQPVRWVRRK